MKRGNVRVFFTSLDLVPGGEKKKLMRNFVDFCVRAMKLESDYSIYIVDDRKRYSIETTAICFPEEGSVRIYGKGRAFVDVLRSMAHELSHLAQHENGGIEYDELHFSSDLEDEANKVAGELVNAFSAVVGYDLVYEGKRENSKKALGPRRDLG